MAFFLFLKIIFPVKAGEGNPQAREEEGKLGLLGLERSSSPAGIPRIWGLEFRGKAAFTSPYQPEHRLWCSLGSALHPWSLSSCLLETAQEDGWHEGPPPQPNCCGGWCSHLLDLVLTSASAC